MNHNLAAWNMQALAATPGVYEAAPSGVEGVRAIFYDGVPWKGKATRVFAYCGIPKLGAGERAPGMVLVHGGGGSAFIPWVQLWMSRGYAAIAMDTCGCVSGGGYENHPRHEHGGPPGWGGFAQIDEPAADQWPFHAVGAVILAHSLLRSFPEVDAQRIGLTGVSWGGYLTCIAAAADDRFAFAAPVYGCGFLGASPVWQGDYAKMGADRARRWLGLWDPAVHLPRVRMPLLWVNGTNDFAYPMDSWQKSYRAASTARTLCLRVRMPHAHGGPGENPPEIHATAEALFRGGIPLARVVAAGREERRAWVVYESAAAVTKAELNCTLDAGPWLARNWQTIPATIDTGSRRAFATLPDGATCYFLNLVDERGCVVSTEHEELLSAGADAGVQA